MTLADLIARSEQGFSEYMHDRCDGQAEIALGAAAVWVGRASARQRMPLADVLEVVRTAWREERRLCSS